jgi:anion-transporting  ArsA/GET3 family ATPase
MDEYLADQLPVPALARRLAGSRFFSYLAAATPGLRELLSVGKAWELAQPQRRTPGADPYDLVVVDAPATGHGLALLTAPQTFVRAARVGPIARQGRRIHATLADPDTTAVVAVATAEEMAVAEGVAIAAGLRERLGSELALAVVNGVLPHRIPPRAAPRLREAARDGELHDDARLAVRAALLEHHRAQVQSVQVGRLRRAVGAPVTALPRLFAAQVGLDELGVLADALAEVTT